MSSNRCDTRHIQRAPQVEDRLIRDRKYLVRSNAGPQQWQVSRPDVPVMPSPAANKETKKRTRAGSRPPESNVSKLTYGAVGAAFSTVAVEPL